MRNGEKSVTIVEVPKDLEEVVSELRKGLVMVMIARRWAFEGSGSASFYTPLAK